MAINLVIDSKLFDAPGQIVTSLQENRQNDYQSILQSFGISGVSISATTLSSTLIVLDNGGGFTTTITGSGIGPISSLADLEAAILNGLATGGFDSVVFRQTSSGIDFLSLNISSAGYSLVSGNQSVAITGAVPSSFAQFYALSNILTSLSNIGSLSQAVIDQIVLDLSAYDISSLTLSDDGEEFLSFDTSATGISVTVAGFTFALNGSFPDNWGEDLALLLQISDLVSSGAAFTLNDITGLALSGLTITAADGTVLASTSGVILGDGTDVLGQITVDGVVVNDYIFGSMYSDYLVQTGSGGHIFGLDGDDLLYGGSGRDFLFGGSGNDFLDGGAGNDVLNPGGNSGYDRIAGSLGNDRIIYTDNFQSFQSLNYAGLSNGITVKINGIKNRGTIDKGASGFDRIIDIDQPLQDSSLTGGFSLMGTSFNDSFTVNGGVGSWIGLFGSDGADVFNVKISGIISLAFWDATVGINVNVAAGFVYEDGLGNQDTLNIRGGAGALQIFGTDFDDQMRGSAFNERFVTRGGDDFIDGKGGVDLIRYDSGGIGVVTVDLAAGTATGTDVNGAAFTDTLVNIENIRGSRLGADILTGNRAANGIEGRGGDDALYGRGGRDRLFGGDDNDRLLGQGGNDFLDGGTGQDILDGGRGDDILRGRAGRDVFKFKGGNIGEDTVRDFKDNVDTLKFDDALWTGVKTAAEVVSQFGSGVDGSGNVVFDFGGGNTVTLLGVTDNSVLADDILII